MVMSCSDDMCHELKMKIDNISPENTHYLHESQTVLQTTRKRSLFLKNHGYMDVALFSPLDAATRVLGSPSIKSSYFIHMFNAGNQSCAPFPLSTIRC